MHILLLYNLALKNNKFADNYLILFVGRLAILCIIPENLFIYLYSTQYMYRYLHLNLLSCKHFFL